MTLSRIDMGSVWGGGSALLMSFIPTGELGIEGHSSMFPRT